MNTLIYMLASMICGAFVVRAWGGDRRDSARQSFLVLGTFASLSFAGFTLYLIPGLSWLRYVHAVAGAFIPASLLWFLDRLFRTSSTGPDPMVRRLWALTPLLAIAYVVVDVSLFLDVPRASPPELVLGACIAAGLGLCLRRLWLEYQVAERVDKARIRYLLFLLGTASAFTMLELLLRSFGPIQDVSGLSMVARSIELQGALPPVGAVLTTVLMYFLFQVTELYRLLDLSEVMSRIFTLTVAALLLVVVDGVTVIWVGSLSSYPLHGTFLIFLASVLFLSVYEPLHRYIEARAGDWLNLRGRRLELTLNEIDHAMAKVISIDGLEVELLGRLHSSGRAPLVSLYLWDRDRRLFRLARSRGPTVEPMMRTIAGKPFADGFTAGQRVYNRPELQRTVNLRLPGYEDAAGRLRTMDAMCADVTLSILSGDLVLGWLNLRDEPWSDGFSHEEIRDLTDTVNRAAIILENITSVEQLKEQHRLAALGTMAAGLAHEIRNPLAGIKGAAQYLQDGPDAPEASDFVTVIVDEVDRLNVVVTQFLDYARPFEVHAEPSDINQLVDHVVGLVRAEGLPDELRVVTELDRGLPLVPVDPDKLLQVLLNLVKNALQALGTAGRVVVRTGTGRLTSGKKRGLPALVIEVEDDGPGISKDDMDNLFIPFFTTKRSGTGLGLAISRRIVEAHGGEISVRSTPGQGSSFTVSVPVPIEPAEVAADETQELAVT